MKKIFITLLLVPNIVFAQQILQTLNIDLQKGELSYEDYLVYKALAVFQPKTLPSKYSSLITGSPIKCGTFILYEIKLNWDRLSPTSQSLLQPFFERPDLPYDIVSHSGRFRIHYTLSGVDAVSPQDDDQNGIPDYVDQVAAIFDYCHSFETDSLGYQSPPNDNGNGGGNEYDIYIQNFRMIYGQTIPEGKVPDKPDTYYSFLEIDNNYYGFPTTGVNGLRVTAAHEYFHAIQMGYKFKEDNSFWNNEIFYYEVCSTWIEDVIYDNINDYYFYLHNFFNNINKPFNTYDGSFEYGNCLWNHMLNKKYGSHIITEIWKEIVNYPVLEAIDRVLQKAGSSFNEELSDYSVWNYFTGSRHDSINYYPEGVNYPEVNFTLSQQFNSDTTVTGSSSQSAFSYYNFYDPEYQYNITLIPLNIEANSDLKPEFKFELSRHDANLFKAITDGFNVRMIVDNYLRWQAHAIVTDSEGKISIVDFRPIEENMITREDPILGFGPNPFIINQHRKFNVYYQLKQKGAVTITIFSENGYKIKDFKYPSTESGVYSFSWDQAKLGTFPNGSGIYLLLFETSNFKELIKFTVIQ